jgi:hypothetical protein
MMMMDVNNLQVADWILSWVEKNVDKNWRLAGGKADALPWLRTTA